MATPVCPLAAVATLQHWSSIHRQNRRGRWERHGGSACPGILRQPGARPGLLTGLRAEWPGEGDADACVAVGRLDDAIALEIHADRVEVGRVLDAGLFGGRYEGPLFLSDDVGLVKRTTAQSSDGRQPV